MTNKATSNSGNFSNVVYDSGRDITDGRKRIAISATEVELLDDIPSSFGIGQNTSRNTVPDQARVFETQQQPLPSNYHTLSTNRVQPKANVVYQEGNDQNLNSAVEKLLEKYAPDAIPQNLLNSKTTRQPQSQVNMTTGRNEPFSSSSTFQVNQPSSFTSSNNYSTVTRPKNGQTPETQTQLNQNRRQQPSTRPRPASSYDSFQHTVPQSSHQPQLKPSVPIKTNNGLVTNVVPGKLYNLEDDPLHLLFDRQNPTSSNPQQATFVSTFQPSNNVSINQDPLAGLYPNTSQRYPEQSQPATTNSNADGIQPFDLGNLIKRVQQDYAREIEPFVSSIKFVEKDREYGQSLADVGFTTPVTVRKGFTRQADDILRRSFNRIVHPRRPINRSNQNDYSDDDDDDDDDDDIDELRPSTRKHPLAKIDSKRSFTSVTSTSTYDSEYDDPNSSLNRKNKVDVHNQATSPLQITNRTNTQPQTQYRGYSTTTPATALKSTTTNETDQEETVTAENRPAPVTLARRVPSNELGTPSIGSSATDEEEDYTTTYNENEHPAPNPAESINAMATNAPIVPSVDVRNRERTNQAPQRSEDIHPAPPTLHSSTNPRAQPKQSDTDESTAQVSGTDLESDSDGEDVTSAPAIALPLATTNRSSVQPNPTNARSAVTTNPPPTNTRGPPATTNSRDAPAPTNARGPPAQNPPVTARTTADNNARQAAGTTATPNIPFVPPDQRAAANDRGGAGPSTTQQTTNAGSTRFFQSDTNAKEKRSIKEGPAAIGNKLKSLFRRK